MFLVRVVSFSNCNIEIRTWYTSVAIHLKFRNITAHEISAIFASKWSDKCVICRMQLDTFRTIIGRQSQIPTIIQILMRNYLGPSIYDVHKKAGF